MQIRRMQLWRHPWCALCLRDDARITPADQVDHILPVSRGGSDDPQNLQSLCGDCHAEKSATERGYRRRPMIGEDGFPMKKR